MSPDSIIKNIEFELTLIERELETVKPLLNKILKEDPDYIEIRAVASTLHAFYNGIEKIFVIIAKNGLLA